MKYFGYYADEENIKNLNCTPAAIDKMNYIASVIKNICDTVEIISMATPRQGKLKSQINIIDKGITLKFFAAKFFPNKVARIVFRYFYFNIKVLFWSLRNVKRNEKIVVYHSLGYMWLFKYLKKIKKIRIVLEVEEIYADVLANKKIRRKELSFFKLADQYIFPTQLLDDEINKEKKESVIIHGTYQVEIDEKCKMAHRNLQNGFEQKIHCVYAGTLDPRKGGALAAAAAEFLPSDYHIHILGFGSEKDIQQMKDLIAKNSSNERASVTYDGVLSGKDYIHFLQSCDIGLSTQDPNAAFNGTSFPSKILSYMANGLRVVSIRIPAIETSAVGDMVFYYDKQTPEEIAKAIMHIEFNDNYDSREYIRQLSNQFKEDMKNLLNN